MPLLTSPSTITDGTTPIIFTYQNQVQIGKAIVSTYKELAAAASALSTIKSKYDVSHPTLNRSVAQINLALPITDGSLKLATFNVSLVAHKQHSNVSLKKLGLYCVGMTTEAEFWDNFLNQI
jgi:thiamine phosphate synthase YjbQ (UPF0047 family)